MFSDPADTSDHHGATVTVVGCVEKAESGQHPGPRLGYRERHQRHHGRGPRLLGIRRGGSPPPCGYSHRSPAGAHPLDHQAVPAPQWRGHRLVVIAPSKTDREHTCLRQESRLDQLDKCREISSCARVALGTCGRDHGSPCQHEMRVSGAPPSGRPQHKCRAWRRSTPISWIDSPRRRSRAGWARSPRSSPPWRSGSETRCHARRTQRGRPARHARRPIFHWAIELRLTAAAATRPSGLQAITQPGRQGPGTGPVPPDPSRRG